MVKDIWQRFPPDDHELKIRSLAGAGAYACDAVIARPVLILSFTNRCGSSFMAECLAATGAVHNAGEILNWQGTTDGIRRYGVATVAGFLARLDQDQAAQGKTLLIKSSIQQLLTLARAGYLGPEGVLRQLRLVHVERRDVLAQGISNAIAAQTQKWTSAQAGNQVEPRYDYAAIQDYLYGALHQNALFREFCAALGLPYLPVTYEDFAEDYLPTVREILHYARLSVGDPDPTQIRLQRQTGPVNREFADRFRAESAERLGSRLGEGVFQRLAQTIASLVGKP
ncbi:MAG: Stf0 family sulfotransferase [Magnetospiraceae bacterium]